MAWFRVAGLDSNAKHKTLTVEAATQEEAMDVAKEKGLYPRQIAPHHDPSPPASMEASTTRPDAYPAGTPEYSAVMLMGYIQVVIGCACCLLGVAALVFARGNAGDAPTTMSIVPGAILVVIGIFQIGLGQLCFCIRDMARNSFHLRDM